MTQPFFRHAAPRALAAAIVVWSAAVPDIASAQHAAPPHTAANPGTAVSAGPMRATGVAALDTLVALAGRQGSALAASRARVLAARARIRPAGTRPDPMLMAGLVTVPIARPSLRDDDFTMLMVGVTQSLPGRGKIAGRTRAAELDAVAVERAVETASLGVRRDVQAAYLEIAYTDRALEITERTRQVLSDMVRLTESRYGTGAGTQQDVLKARIEAARLGETASALRESRRSTASGLASTVEQPVDSLVSSARIPKRMMMLAVATDAETITFTAQTLGSRVAGSPLPPLDVLTSRAIVQNPLVREHEARIDAQRARLALARIDHRPDVDVTLQYNHRPAYADLVTAQVSIPLRLQRSSKQEQAVAESLAELAAMEAEHRAEVNAVRARVTALVSDIERERTRLALYVKAILPQSRAAVASAVATYQSGRTDLMPLLDLQNTVHMTEIAYWRGVTDVALAVSELELLVGGEVLP